MSILATLISLVIWGLIFYVLYWGLSKIALPEPFGKVATVILVLAAVIVVIGILTGGIAPFGFINSLVLK
jgi:hypothetical protein